MPLTDPQGRIESEVRASVDITAIREFIDRNYEPADQVVPSSTYSFACELRDLPADLDGRIEGMKKLLESRKASLRRDTERYEKYRLNGIDALSGHELMFEGGGVPERAINNILMLKRCHICSSLSVIPILTAQLIELEAERSKAGFQMVMF